jgi:rhodanese-related sulfurtransferase
VRQAPAFQSRMNRMYRRGMLPYEIEPTALAALLKQAESGAAAPLMLLDVRERWEMDVAPFPGSVAMPMGDVPSRAHAELDPDQPIIAICHHGMRSLSVTAWLRREGFEQAQSLAGGTDGWAQTIDPTMPRY